VKQATKANERSPSASRGSDPAEGENGVFTQAWYAVCMSSDVAPGQVIGTEFLDGRIAVYRGKNGTPRVVGAYCPHLGARLDAGAVVDITSSALP